MERHQVPDDRLDAIHFVGLLAVLGVVALSVLVVVSRQFVDGQAIL